MTEKPQNGDQIPIFRPDNKAPKAAETAVSYSSRDLFHGAQEIAIEHQGSSYRLRITRTGGLILNK